MVKTLREVAEALRQQSTQFKGHASQFEQRFRATEYQNVADMFLDMTKYYEQELRVLNLVLQHVDDERLAPHLTLTLMLILQQNEVFFSRSTHLPPVERHQQLLLNAQSALGEFCESHDRPDSPREYRDVREALKRAEAELERLQRETRIPETFSFGR